MTKIIIGAEVENLEDFHDGSYDSLRSQLFCPRRKVNLNVETNSETEKDADAKISGNNH